MTSRALRGACFPGRSPYPVDLVHHPHFHEGVVVVVDRFVVNAERHVHPGLEEFIDRRDAVADVEVATGMVGNRGAALGQERDVLLVDPDGMPVGDVAIHQPQVVEVGQQRLAVLHNAVGPLVRGLQRVDVQRNATQFVGPGLDAPQQIGRHAVRPAGRQENVVEVAVVLGIKRLEQLKVLLTDDLAVVGREGFGQGPQFRRQRLQEFALVTGEAVDVSHGRRIGQPDAGFLVAGDADPGLGQGLCPHVVPAVVMDGGEAHAQMADGSQRTGQLLRQGDPPRPVEDHVLQIVEEYAGLDAAEAVAMAVSVDQAGHHQLGAVTDDAGLGVAPLKVGEGAGFGNALAVDQHTPILDESAAVPGRIGKDVTATQKQRGGGHGRLPFLRSGSLAGQR